MMLDIMKQNDIHNIRHHETGAPPLLSEYRVPWRHLFPAAKLGRTTALYFAEVGIQALHGLWAPVLPVGIISERGGASTDSFNLRGYLY